MRPLHQSTAVPSRQVCFVLSEGGVGEEDDEDLRGIPWICACLFNRRPDHGLFGSERPYATVDRP